MSEKDKSVFDEVLEKSSEEKEYDDIKLFGAAGNDDKADDIETLTEDEIIARLFAKPVDEEQEEPEKKPEVSFKEMYEEKKHSKETGGKTRVFRKVKETAEEESGHTKISGQPEPEKRESRYEEEFKEARKDKIAGFRVFTEKLTDTTVYNDEAQRDSNAADMVKAKKGEDVFSAVEKLKKPKKENTKRNEIIKQRNSKVYDKIDVGRVKLELKADAEKNRMRFIAVAVVTALSAIIEIIRLIYVSGRFAGLMPLMTENSYIVYIASAVLSLPIMVVSADMLISKLKSGEKFKPGNELMLIILCLANLFHTVVQLIYRESISSSVLFFNLALGVIALIVIQSRRQESSMIMKNLATITGNEKILGIYPLGSETAKLAAGISASVEPAILCAGEVEVPDSFMESSTIKDKQDDFMKIAVPCVPVFATVCAVIAGLTYGTLTAVSTAFVSAALITAPAFMGYTLVSLLAKTNRSLNRSGCEILGYEAVECIDDTDAIVLDTADIFSGEISKFHIINSASPIDTIQAFSLAAAMIIESEGVLSGEVAALVKEQKMRLPAIDELRYEERLGLSCWIGDKRVLLGTRQMMTEHNLVLPGEYIEAAYKKDGKEIFYLAADSQVIAMFCTEYFIGRQAKKQLGKLYRTGIILMLMSSDPHIDEGFVAGTIGIDVSSVKIISPSGAETVKQSIDKSATQKRTGLIFKRNVAGLLKVINAAFRLYDVQSLTLLMQAISIGFSFAISVVLNIVATSFFFSPLLIVLYHLFWVILSLMMTGRK